MRDLGTFYHAKAQAIGAAESIVEFLNIEADEMSSGEKPLPTPNAIHITVTDLEVLSPEGQVLAEY